MIGRYGVIAFGGGAVVFFAHQVVGRIPSDVLMVLDASGLSLFAIAGTEKALEHKINPFIASLMGTITGVGGGTLRDLLKFRLCSALTFTRPRPWRARSC